MYGYNPHPFKVAREEFECLCVVGWEVYIVEVVFLMLRFLFHTFIYLSRLSSPRHKNKGSWVAVAEPTLKGEEKNAIEFYIFLLSFFSFQFDGVNIYSFNVYVCL